MNKRVIWMVARQHPGEAMAEWFVEGFLDRLTDPHDGASMRVLEHAVFYVVGIASQPDQNCFSACCTLQGLYHTRRTVSAGQFLCKAQPRTALLLLACLFNWCLAC